MAMLKLTAAALDALKPPTDTPQAYYWDSEQAGLGVVVGRTGRKTFVARGRVNGELVKRTIGVAGAPRDADGHVWTVALARIEARKLLGQMASGAAPETRAESRAATGPTLRDAIELHVARMRKSEGSPRSIEEFERETNKHLGDWLDAPITTITRTACRELHEKLTEASGLYLANRVMRYVRAAWNTMLKEHDLPANPTIAVMWNKEHRRQEPVPWVKLPELYERILKLESSVRRDYYLTLMLSGLRKMDAATIRWESANLTDEPVSSRVWNARRERWEDVELPPFSLLRPNPKGGADHAFSIPLSGELVKVLTRRRDENRTTIAGGDAGWAFPTETWVESECHDCAALGQPPHKRDAKIHLIEPREDGIPSPHRWRDTYTTAAAESGISGYAIDVLTNHRPPKGSVTAGYIDLGIDHLAECQETITKYLLARTKRKPPTKAKLKAVG
jgi:integrase